MLRIRLTRLGSNQKPFYRVVVSDSRKTPRARVVDSLGFYNPAVRPARVEIDLAKAEHWIGLGAHPSVTVKSLMTQLKKAKPVAS